MIEINAYVSSFYSKDKPCKFGVVLDGGGEKFQRSYKVGDAKSLNHMSLLGVLFAIGCITKKDLTIKFHTTNRYIIGMLEKDENGWLKAANVNQDIIADIRRRLVEFTAFSAEFDKSSENMNLAASLIK